MRIPKTGNCLFENTNTNIVRNCMILFIRERQFLKLRSFPKRRGMILYMLILTVSKFGEFSGMYSDYTASNHFIRSRVYYTYTLSRL